MKIADRAGWPGFTRLRAFIFALLILPLLSWAALSPVSVQAAEDGPPPRVATLLQDTGQAGLQEMLRRLSTTARLMQTVAHPDDEDGGMLTLEARGKGVDTVLLTLNRGEGGQNKLGSNLFDVLGVLRTLELTAADRYYGVEQRFTRVADFGFSKTAPESLQKWQGGEPALADMVYVIRQFRPDVIAARFSGTDRDGHGHHQVSSLLARQAFRVAADPTRFPEQIKAGLLPWQAQKLYIGNVCGFNASTCPDADYTLRLNTGVQDPVLGTSYIQFAMQGLKHQLSQGAGGWTIDPGDRFTYYKLVDSVAPTTKDGVHEKDFFDGIDTSLPGLASRLGKDEGKVPYLRPELVRIQQQAIEAGKNAGTAAPVLLVGAKLTRELIAKIDSSSLSAPAKDDLLLELRTKESQFTEAANLAAGVNLTAEVEAPAGSSPDTAFMAVPGQIFRVRVKFASSISVKSPEISLDLPPGWKAEKSGTSNDQTFTVKVAPDAEYTRPYWHRDNPETDAINIVDVPRYATLPLPPLPVHASATYVVASETGKAESVATVKYHDEAGEQERALAVAPAYSVTMEPVQRVIAAGKSAELDATVAISSNLSYPSKGRLQLAAPTGWRAEPSEMSVDLPATGTTEAFHFKIHTGDINDGRSVVRATLTAAGSSYSEGYSVVARPDLDTFYYYQPAIQRVSAVDVKLPQNLKVGYVMGAGDEIPDVLKELGMDVTSISPENLTSVDLSRFQTIVLGIRAYDTQKALAANNPKLLEWTKAGGTLIVQYNASVGDFNAGKFTPFPATLGRSRVSVEEAPVKILAPNNPIFYTPNELSAKDFDGWIQERGLYFMTQWDPNFVPLLESHDPGEAEQKGGMLEAHYGKGIYIYAGYAFFRQLPAGVPGAVRLYVNLLSAKGN
jgi:LmbE family N-acetylglucosaminyl deacetylase